MHLTEAGGPPILRPMPISRSPRGRLVRALSGLALTATVSAPALAAPAAFTPLAPVAAAASAADAVNRFLVDRGMIPPAQGHAEAAGPSFAAQVRDRASDMVLTAMNFLGVRYQRGGASADSGFDCSGFTRLVFETSLGLVLPRRADEQASAAGMVPVKRDELQPGDLVFFNTLRRTFSHVGIYIGDGKFIHAPRPGGEVRIEDMRFVYWAKRFTGARRAEPVAEASAAASLMPIEAAAPLPALR